MEAGAQLADRWRIVTGFVDPLGVARAPSLMTIERIATALSASGAPPVGDFVPVAPQLAFQGSGRRAWLLAVQLYAVRSRRNWGHGDFTDLAALLQLASQIGAAGVGLNPLHALMWDRPGHASPYAPNSRLFLNPLYIDVSAIPGYSPDPSLDRDIARLQDARLVDYQGVARLKGRALRDCYRAFRRASADDGRMADFNDFRHERGEALRRFAAFETLRRRHAGGWRNWPQRWRRPGDEALTALHEAEADEIGFHQFVQWTADRQLRACAALAHELQLPVGLYVDVAVGVDPDGADAWSGQDVFLDGVSIGAPPDAFNSEGQNWKLTSHNPHALAARDFAPLRGLLQSAMRYAGAIRLDHVLGLNRLYLIPEGSDATEGAYVRLPFEQLLSVVAEASRNHRCIVIGEDLGAVPEGFRVMLAAWGVWSYRVMMFERAQSGAFLAPHDYPERAIATFNTHDLPPFEGWIAGHDLRVRRALGIDPGETEDQRDIARRALRAALHDDAVSFASVIDTLAGAPSRLLSVAIEDVLQATDQVNIPGTVDEHPNWRRRLPSDVEDLPTDQRLLALASLLARAGRGSC